MRLFSYEVPIMYQNSSQFLLFFVFILENLYHLEKQGDPPHTYNSASAIIKKTNLGCLLSIH